MIRIPILVCLIAAGCFFQSTEGVPVPDERNILTCAICQQLVRDISQGFANGETDEEISARVGNLCETLGIPSYTYKVCYGTALIAMPTVRFIFNSTEFIEGNVCGILLQGQNCALSDPEMIEWVISPSNIPKPPVTPPSPPPQGSPTIKVLHLSDLHWDPEYLEGSLASCSDSLCCRENSGNVTDPADAAGYWGDYRVCDLPWRTIEKAVQHMAQQHPDVGYIVWTGDLVPHDLWSTDKNENLMIMDRLFGLMKQYFPNTTLYATLGNHESHPVDVFAPPEINESEPELSTSWLYNEADVQWSRWLPTDVSSTVRYGGYYTALVHPGLRIVSMNMNYCYTFNWWTMYKSQDPASGLLWLKGVLERAEQAGEKVHILSHIPPGDYDCWSIWSREFAKLINRFESTVAAQFYGHTHWEEYKVFYDAVDISRPVNVAFVGGSLTSYVNLNPSYRVYTIDGNRPNSSYAVLDFTTWIMDLKSANLSPAQDPVWFPLYTATSEYGLGDLSPTSMDGLFKRMLRDMPLFDLYFKNYHKAMMDVVDQGCDAKCHERILCFIVTVDMADRSRCDVIPQEVALEKRY